MPWISQVMRLDACNFVTETTHNITLVRIIITEFNVDGKHVQLRKFTAF